MPTVWQSVMSVTGYMPVICSRMPVQIPRSAEIIDITRGGVRVRLTDNGAVAFIPGTFIHPVKDELQCSQETGSVLIKGEVRYRLNDIIPVKIEEVKMETRSILARPL